MQRLREGEKGKGIVKRFESSLHTGALDEELPRRIEELCGTPSGRAQAAERLVPQKIIPQLAATPSDKQARIIFLFLRAVIDALAPDDDRSRGPHGSPKVGRANTSLHSQDSSSSTPGRMQAMGQQSQHSVVVDNATLFPGGGGVGGGGSGGSSGAARPCPAALAARFGRGFPAATPAPFDLWLCAWVKFVTDYAVASDEARDTDLETAAVSTIVAACEACAWFAGGMLRLYLSRPGKSAMSVAKAALRQLCLSRPGLVFPLLAEEYERGVRLRSAVLEMAATIAARRESRLGVLGRTTLPGLVIVTLEAWDIAKPPPTDADDDDDSPGPGALDLADAFTSSSSSGSKSLMSPNLSAPPPLRGVAEDEQGSDTDGGGGGLGAGPGGEPGAATPQDSGNSSGSGSSSLANFSQQSTAAHIGGLSSSNDNIDAVEGDGTVRSEPGSLSSEDAITAILFLTMMLPMAPGELAAHVPMLCETAVSVAHRAPQGVIGSLVSLFRTLYSFFPRHTVQALRGLNGQASEILHREIFRHGLPLHPLLATPTAPASHEISPQRFSNPAEHTTAQAILVQTIAGWDGGMRAADVWELKPRRRRLTTDDDGPVDDDDESDDDKSDDDDDDERGDGDDDEAAGAGAGATRTGPPIADEEEVGDGALVPQGSKRTPSGRVVCGSCSQPVPSSGSRARRTMRQRSHSEDGELFALFQNRDGGNPAAARVPGGAGGGRSDAIPWHNLDSAPTSRNASPLTVESPVHGSRGVTFNPRSGAGPTQPSGALETVVRDRIEHPVPVPATAQTPVLVATAESAHSSSSLGLQMGTFAMGAPPSAHAHLPHKQQQLQQQQQQQQQHESLQQSTARRSAAANAAALAASANHASGKNHETSSKAPGPTMQESVLVGFHNAIARRDRSSAVVSTASELTLARILAMQLHIERLLADDGGEAVGLRSALSRCEVHFERYQRRLLLERLRSISREATLSSSVRGHPAEGGAGGPFGAPGTPGGSSATHHHRSGHTHGGGQGGRHQQHQHQHQHHANPGGIPRSAAPSPHRPDTPLSGAGTTPPSRQPRSPRDSPAGGSDGAGSGIGHHGNSTAGDQQQALDSRGNNDVSRVRGSSLHQPQTPTSVRAQGSLLAAMYQLRSRTEAMEREAQARDAENARMKAEIARLTSLAGGLEQQLMIASADRQRMEKLEREAEESKSLIKVLGDRLTQCARDAEVSSLRAGIVTRQQAGLVVQRLEADALREELQAAVRDRDQIKARLKVHEHQELSQSSRIDALLSDCEAAHRRVADEREKHAAEMSALGNKYEGVKEVAVGLERYIMELGAKMERLAWELEEARRALRRHEDHQQQLQGQQSQQTRVK